MFVWAFMFRSSSDWRWRGGPWGERQGVALLPAGVTSSAGADSSSRRGSLAGLAIITKLASPARAEPEQSTAMASSKAIMQSSEGVLINVVTCQQSLPAMTCQPYVASPALQPAMTLCEVMTSPLVVHSGRADPKVKCYCPGDHDTQRPSPPWNSRRLWCWPSMSLIIDITYFFNVWSVFRRSRRDWLTCPRVV